MRPIPRDVAFDVGGARLAVLSRDADAPSELRSAVSVRIHPDDAKTPTRPRTGRNRRVRWSEPVDAASAERTIPRGASRDDLDRTPAVDRSVWLDHIVFARTDDGWVLERLVHEYEGYARSLARRLHRTRAWRDDVDQVALEALIVALRRFDPERSIPFLAFAAPTITGLVRRSYRDLGWALRVPRPAHELAGRERAVVDELSMSLGRHPTAGEVAAAVGCSLDSLRSGQVAANARRVRSLDEEGPGGAPSLQLGECDAAYLLVEDRCVAAQAIALLDAPSRQLLRLYYVEGRTQAEIAAETGVSQMQISRLLAAVLRRLQAHVAVGFDG